MIPGLNCDDSKVQPGLSSTTDWVQYFLDLPMDTEPGTKWIYCSGAGHLLSAFIHNEMGTDTRTYANQNFFTPPGVSQVAEQDWAHDPQRITNGMAGLYLTARDLAKYGYLYLNRGKWADQQLVSAEWVAQSTREQAYIGKDEYVGGLDRRFGYLGRGGQELFVLPEENLVMVFTGALRVGEERTLLNLVKAAGTKQAVLVLPQIALDISNKTYKLESNFLGWSEMKFHFEPVSDEAVLRITDSPDLKIGLDNRYRLTESPNTRPIGLRGHLRGSIPNHIL